MTRSHLRSYCDASEYQYRHLPAPRLRGPGLAVGDRLIGDGAIDIERSRPFNSVGAHWVEGTGKRLQQMYATIQQLDQLLPSGLGLCLYRGVAPPV